MTNHILRSLSQFKITWHLTQTINKVTLEGESQFQRRNQFFEEWIGANLLKFSTSVLKWCFHGSCLQSFIRFVSSLTQTGILIGSFYMNRPYDIEWPFKPPTVDVGRLSYIQTKRT